MPILAPYVAAEAQAEAGADVLAALGGEAAMSSDASFAGRKRGKKAAAARHQRPVSAPRMALLSKGRSVSGPGVGIGGFDGASSGGGGGRSNGGGVGGGVGGNRGSGKKNGSSRLSGRAEGRATGRANKSGSRNSDGAAGPGALAGEARRTAAVAEEDREMSDVSAGGGGGELNAGMQEAYAQSARARQIARRRRDRHLRPSTADHVGLSSADIRALKGQHGKTRSKSGNGLQSRLDKQEEGEAGGTLGNSVGAVDYHLDRGGAGSPFLPRHEIGRTSRAAPSGILNAAVPSSPYAWAPSSSPTPALKATPSPSPSLYAPRTGQSDEREDEVTSMEDVRKSLALLKGKAKVRGRIRRSSGGGGNNSASSGGSSGLSKPTSAPVGFSDRDRRMQTGNAAGPAAEATAAAASFVSGSERNEMRLLVRSSSSARSHQSGASGRGSSPGAPPSSGAALDCEAEDAESVVSDSDDYNYDSYDDDFEDSKGNSNGHSGKGKSGDRGGSSKKRQETLRGGTAHAHWQGQAQAEAGIERKRGGGGGGGSGWNREAVAGSPYGYDEDFEEEDDERPAARGGDDSFEDQDHDQKQQERGGNKPLEPLRSEPSGSSGQMQSMWQRRRWKLWQRAENNLGKKAA